MKTAADIVQELRIDLDVTDSQPAQIMYESWLKDDRWGARAAAIPLLVGCDPKVWQAYLGDHGLQAQEEMLWHSVANDLGLEANASAPVGELRRVGTSPIYRAASELFTYL